MSKSKILYQLSGSIAAYKACSVISALIQEGHEVRIACTPSALQFVGKATLEGLTGYPVYDQIFEERRAMDHIQLARWADLAVLAPATATSIARLANGLGEDAVSCLFLAWEVGQRPYLVAPAMNHAMYSHPATQGHLKTLSSWGVRVLPVGEGHQACGETGAGRFLEPEQLLAEIRTSLPQPLASTRDPKRILITGGGTREAVDGVRFLTNFSTGQTAATLCDRWAAQGHQVTALFGRDSKRPKLARRTEEYESFSDLDRELRKILAEETFDLVVHLAAVSDYSVSAVSVKGRDLPPSEDLKLPSSIDGLTLRLAPNFKIIQRLRQYALPRKPKVVAFKLTRSANPKERVAAVKKLDRESHPDVIVHNDFADRAAGQPLFTLYRSGASSRSATDYASLADSILQEVFS